MCRVLRFVSADGIREIGFPGGEMLDLVLWGAMELEWTLILGNIGIWMLRSSSIRFLYIPNPFGLRDGL